MKTGVLLINLGTPDSPSTRDVRKYLTEFLNDPFVIDIHWLKRLLLVNFIIVPFRAPRSAKLYKKIWKSQGSPLLVHGQAVAEKLQQELGDDFLVGLAMRYQNPGIESVLKEMSAANLSQIIALPLYPQFAGSSTQSTVVKMKRVVKQLHGLPRVTYAPPFYAHPGFINAWVDAFSKYDISSYDHLLFSFHGLPERHVLKEHPTGNCETHECMTEINEGNKNCYRAQCYATVRAIIKRFPIQEQGYTVCFQSRLGSDPWIRPFSDEVIVQKAREGAKKLLIASPSFVADCLETLYEIGVEYDVLFKSHGGEKVALVNSLNDSNAWIAALKEMVLGLKPPDE